MKAVVQHGEEAIEVDLDSIQLPEGHRFISQVELGSIAKAEKEQGRRTKEAELKAHYESEDYLSEALKARGFQFSEDGLPVPIDDAVAKDARLKQYQRWESQHVQPLKTKYEDELGKTKSKLVKYQDSLLEKQILEAAVKANIKDEYLKTLGNSKPLIYDAVKSNLGWFEDGDTEGWFVKDGDSYKIGADGKPVDVLGLFSDLQSKEDAQGFFKDVRRQTSGLAQPTAKGGALNSQKWFYENSEKLSPAEYERYANHYIRNRNK